MIDPLGRRLPRPDDPDEPRPLYCAAGDILGAHRFFADVLAFEGALGETFDHVLHVGDFGIWPDPERVDRATRAHKGACEFPRWFALRAAAPRPILFIAGNHEDFDSLGALQGDQVLPGLRHLRSGEATLLGGRLRVAGIGGCYDVARPGPASFGDLGHDGIPSTDRSSKPKRPSSTSGTCPGPIPSTSSNVSSP